jgi:membrane-bound metal-dependent hydrolase YbcI (DUF457 family)
MTPDLLPKSPFPYNCTRYERFLRAKTFGDFIMTPVSHSFFGFTAGFILSPLTSRFGISRKKTVFLCTWGAVIPDIDAISLVLDKGVYFGLKWYSHHGLTHSFTGAFLLSMISTALFHPSQTFRIRQSRSVFQEWIITLAIIFVGAALHLPCDMVTLPGVWRGIPLWAPFSWTRYGGWAHIPWSDYYLIYVSIGTYLLFIPIWTLETALKKNSPTLPVLSILLLSWAIVHVYQSRFINYRQWEQEQRRLLGEDLYRFARSSEKALFQTIKNLK